jgi:hypothetical protein
VRRRAGAEEIELLGEERDRADNNQEKEKSEEPPHDTPIARLSG